MVEHYQDLQVFLVGCIVDQALTCECGSLRIAKLPTKGKQLIQFHILVLVYFTGKKKHGNSLKTMICEPLPFKKR